MVGILTHIAKNSKVVSLKSYKSTLPHFQNLYTGELNSSGKN